MRKRLRNLIFGREIEIRERLFRMIMLIGIAAAILGFLESTLLLGISKMTFPMLFVLVVMLIALRAVLKYRNMRFSAIIVGLTIIVVVFPYMFFICGGVQGGAAHWLSLALFYVFIMFSGKRMVFFCILAVVTDCIVYWIAYTYPYMVIPLGSRQEMYLDSLFSVMAVGFACGFILKLQMDIFQEERSITLSQKEELEKISKSKDTFFTSMSHEIRTPINTIIGLNEMILRESKEDATREYAQNIQSASKMLLNLVNDILDLSQMEIKKMEIIPVEYRTEEMFRELVVLMQIRMQEKGLEFFVDIDKNLPTVLFGDEKRIKQILVNILTNAVKYTEKGSVTLSVRAEAASEGKVELKVSVEDTGIGIKKEDLEYLYDTFQRIDEKNNRGIEGSGLGLSITKKLVDLMGGEITVDSIYTKGSIFTVILEQEVVDAAPIGSIKFQDKGQREERPYYERSFEAPEARILIVDDNMMNSVVAEKLLADTKVKVDIAESGEECLEKTRQKYYHIILMDYLMPGMDGIETLKELRRQENGLCRESVVIALTASSMDSEGKNYQDYGFDGYLEKPIQGTRLEEEILRFLPEDIVEYRKSQTGNTGEESRIRQFSKWKRKKIYITTDCVSDLPEELLKKYDIKQMYLYIKTAHGRFADTREIDSDNLFRYLTESSSTAYADSVLVEEYEAFFAEALTQADHIIHISMAANAGKSYGIAVAAAKSFDHVQVIDSANISGGQGLVVLYAAKLAMEGCGVNEICTEIEKMKRRVAARFLLPTSKIFYQNGHTDSITYKICEMFHLRPVAKVQRSRMVIEGFRRGRLEKAQRNYIRHHLAARRRISTDVVYITYVGCSVKEQERIQQEVLKCVPFQKVIMQKASFSNACNAGMGTIGIAYYERSKNEAKW